MSWHFLQEGVEASWQQSCLDGAPSALLSLILEHDKYCSTDNETEFSINSLSGMTCEHSMGTSGKGKSTLSQADSRAKTLASAALDKDLMVKEVGCGRKWHGLLAKYDPNTHSLKTAQCSLIEDSSESLQTWPKWGFLRNGECFELPALEPAIIEPDFTWLLTPTAQSWKAWTFRSPLALIRKNHADGNLQEQLMRLYQRMITPRCQEILMMWPEGWTDSKPLAMDGFRHWLLEHGAS